VCGSVETFGCHDEVFAAVVAAAAKMFSWLHSKPNQTPAYSIEFSVVFPGFYHAPSPNPPTSSLSAKIWPSFWGSSYRQLRYGRCFRLLALTLILGISFSQVDPQQF